MSQVQTLVEDSAAPYVPVTIDGECATPYCRSDNNVSHNPSIARVNVSLHKLTRFHRKKLLLSCSFHAHACAKNCGAPIDGPQDHDAYYTEEHL